MSFLQKRETPVQNIAYIGIMAAINIVFVLISSLLPILFVILVFVLPLTSVIVTLYCKKVYYPIYFVATLGLCFAVTAGFSVFDTFIYVLPSLITGFVFGLLIEKGVSGIYILIINTIIQYLLTYLTFLFLNNVVFHVSFFESIYNMIGLRDFAFKWVLTNIFTYVVAQIQIVITYIVIKYETLRLGKDINLNIQYRFTLYIVTFVGVIMTVLACLFFPQQATLITLLVLPITVYEVFDLAFKRSVLIYVLLGIVVLVSMFLFASIYQFVPSPNQLCLLNIFFVMITIIDFISNYCLKEKVKTIE